MRTQIIKIGNSQGIRIPKTLLAQIGLTGEVELEVMDNKLVVSAVKSVRAGWAEAFQQMAANQDDQLIDGEIIEHSWDEEQWQW